MVKFQLVCDPQAKTNGSSRIIVDAFNNAAKNIGLFDANGIQVNYDCLGQTHGLKTHVQMVAYELPFPRFILDSLQGRPVLGLSKDNGLLAIYGGYPTNLVNYVNLGVNCEQWKYCYKETQTEKFRFLCANESNTRSGFPELLKAFIEEFKNEKGVELYIKDRNGTDRFKRNMQDFVDGYDNIIYDDRDLGNVDSQLAVFSSADVFICTNRSHTFGMNRLQALSCGIPLLTTSYQGGAEYMHSPMVGYRIDYDVKIVETENLKKAENIWGLKNHLFYPDGGSYINAPFWSIAKHESIKAEMRRAYSNREFLKSQSLAARRLAETFTWERAAANMSIVLDQFVKDGIIVV